MNVQLDDTSFEVIGSTVTFTRDNLPRRLRPIYRRDADDAIWFVAVTQNRDESRDLAYLDSAEARDLAEEGHALLWEATPLPARVGHVLIQISPENGPEYLAPLDVPHRLRQAESDALRRAAEAFAAKDQDLLLRWLWYARRASLDDPLPLMLLLRVLERAGEPIDDLRVLASELARFDRASIQAASERLRTSATLTSFETLGARPQYLPPGAASLADAARWARGSSARSV